ncbi:hypothetical protein CFAM422_009157 [Trichoderma lentiforme]|uniref:Uncharacterized protein n=1 Tax=Trichoderma lentiforme TaxID=1567552 RepID=A0A9P5C8X7_9HYPO|nr:hypothetical protein CFAM422_009157 [Trichoderma lentiforme]
MTRVSDAGGIRTERFKQKLLHSEVRRRQDGTAVGKVLDRFVPANRSRPAQEHKMPCLKT